NHEDINGMIKFIELCNEKNLLNNWTIALKTTGSSKSELESDLFNFPKRYNDISMAIRRGPESGSDLAENFINKFEFKATGRNANIVSTPTDLSLQLSDQQKKNAEEKFIQEKVEYYLNKNFSKEEALKKAEKITKPGSIYREQMSDQQGLLVIYLFDPIYAFNLEGGTQRPPKEYEKFNQFVKDEGINPNIPLIGYAIGFPPMEEDIGGVFMKGDYDLDDVLEEDEPSENEMNEDLNIES
ncbi:MAG: hypothetical protein ACI8Q1_003535, partial [Parvicella sp.]